MAPDEGRNIVLLVVDTLSAFHLPLHGYDRETMPFLTRLARDNCHATYGYAPSPWTAPSHASLFTGDLPSDHGTTTSSPTFDADSVVADLADRGYRTAGFSANPTISASMGFDAGFDTLRSGRWPIRAAHRDLPAMERMLASDRSGPVEYISFLHDVVAHRDPRSVPEALRFLTSRFRPGGRDVNYGADSGARTVTGAAADAVQDEGRFFLFLNLMEPHLPYAPPLDAAGRWGRSRADVVRHVRAFRDADETFRWRCPADLMHGARDLYDASLRALDGRIESFYRRITAEHPDTVFIIVGDHGENIGDYGMAGHMGGIWEKLVRVPVIIAGPSVPQMTLDRNVSLRHLPGYIRGDTPLHDLGADRVFAEYHGMDGVLGFTDENPQAFPDADRPYLANRSRCVVDGRDGHVENTALPDTAFRAAPDGAAPVPAGDGHLTDLLADRFGPLSGIDV